MWVSTTEARSTTTMLGVRAGGAEGAKVPDDASEGAHWALAGVVIVWSTTCSAATARAPSVVGPSIEKIVAR